AGIYYSLPLAFRTLKKIESIIRDEMNKIGGLEISMPVVNPAEIWKETGRFYSIDAELSRFKDRADRDMVLAMTHEESVTDIMRDEIQTYRQLPVLVYQIQTKWRDDPRPRAGLIRVREFVMKDSYSFDRDYEGLEAQYQAHYDAYFRIFERCGLPVIAVAADSGMMGGKVSHEYMYLNPIGEDTIILCPACGYQSNKQVAVFHKQLYAESQKPLEETATPDTKTIEELCAFLNIEPRQTAKAVFLMGQYQVAENSDETTEKLIVAVVRGDMDVEEAKVQNAARALSLRPAHDDEIKALGMVPGYGSVIGIPVDEKRLVVIVDDAAAGTNNLVAGANKEGFHLLNSNFARDYQGTIADIATAKEGYLCPECKKPLTVSRGVEVGNIFQLGTRYSEAMNCTYQDENGRQQPVIMGSYGIGVGRLLACLAEEYHDDKGLSLPVQVAPFHVHIVDLLKEGGPAEELYTALESAGIEVLLDDRKESPGVKFNDADLIGIPVRVTFGKKSFDEGGCEISLRRDGEKFLVPLSDAVTRIHELLGF
ncbi:MAG: proline--tRNA ligase, partial [Spirochaetales bacterium]|nr:proline--tRNA ligase [Spirochaetales bacterium]